MFTIGQGIDIGSGITITYEYPEAPTNTVLPVITGTAQVRLTLNVNNGIWDPGIPPPILAYTYQWKYNGNIIPGATSNSYLISYLYVGTNITCDVTAVNASGANSVTTVQTASVLANVPAAPAPATATSGNIANVVVSFTPPIDDGGSPVTLYYATSNTGGFTGNSAVSPITVQALNLGETYTFNVVAENSVGNSLPATTNSITVNQGLTVGASLTTVSTPESILISPDNKHVYVSNQTGIRLYTRNLSTGVLTFTASYVAGGVAPISDMVINSAGTLIYVVYLSSGTNATIQQFSRNTTTGALTNLGTDPGLIGTEFLILSPDGSKLFGTGYSSSLDTLVRRWNVGVGGNLTFAGTYSTGVQSAVTRGLAVSQDNNNLYYGINKASPAISNLYNWDISSGNLLQTVNTANIGSSGRLPSNIVVSYDDKQLYMSFNNTSNIAKFDRNISTGNITLNGVYAGGANPSQIAVIPTTDNILYTGGGVFYRNITTGNLAYQSGSTSLNTSCPDAVVSPDTKNVYTINASANTVVTYNVV
jgi:hypothetical protein